MHGSQLPVVGSDCKMGFGSTPFFSIGVATYDRPELLKQTLVSIIEQTFSDFEVIVGNDNPLIPISSEALGINDPRIRIFNWERNLGELANMNALVAMSQGRYFTWIADDDLYAPDFLQKVRAAISDKDPPQCVFTSFKVVRGAIEPKKLEIRNTQIMSLSGREFLRDYFSGKIKTITSSGIYNLDVLRDIGMAEELCDAPIGILAEYWLLVRCGLLKEVVYVDSPLVYFRAHKDSYSTKNSDVQRYKIAGYNLVRKSLPVLNKPELARDIYRNLLGTIKIASAGAVIASSRTNHIVPLRELGEYFSSLKAQVNTCESNGTRRQMMAAVFVARMWLFLWLWPLGAFRTFAPEWFVRIALKVRSIILGEE